MALAQIPHLEREQHFEIAGVPLVTQVLHGTVDEFGAPLFKSLRVGVIGTLEDHPDPIHAWVGQQRAERRTAPRMDRYDDPVHALAGGQVDGMERTRATERDEVEVPVVMAAVNRDEPDGAGHVLVDGRQDGRRNLNGCQPEGLTEFLQAPLRSGAVYRQTPAQQRLRVQPSEEEIRIGDRRFGPAGCRSRPGRDSLQRSEARRAAFPQSQSRRSILLPRRLC